MSGRARRVVPVADPERRLPQVVVRACPGRVGPPEATNAATIRTMPLDASIDRNRSSGRTSACRIRRAIGDAPGGRSAGTVEWGDDERADMAGPPAASDHPVRRDAANRDAHSPAARPRTLSRSRRGVTQSAARGPPADDLKLELPFGDFGSLWSRRLRACCGPMRPSLALVVLLRVCPHNRLRPRPRAAPSAETRGSRPLSARTWYAAPRRCGGD